MKQSAAMKYRKTLLFLVKFFLFAALGFSFILLWFMYYNQTYAFYSYRGNYVMVGSYLFFLGLFFFVYGGFKVGYFRLAELVYSQILSVTLTNIIIYVQLSLIVRMVLDPTEIILMGVVQIALILPIAYFANRLYFLLYPARDIVLIYGDYDNAVQFKEKIKLAKDKYKLCEMVSQQENFEEIKRLIHKYNSVMLIDVNARFREILLSYCYDLNKRMYIIPGPSDIIIKNSLNSQIFDSPVMLCKNRGLSTEQMLIKRVIDIVLSLVGIIITSPFMLIIALAIKLCDRGPVLFTQQRMTEGERIFTLYKFRSMIVDADKDNSNFMAQVNDDRITPVGKVIRRIRVDELPQLFNILKGDMSIVGPRPERLELIEEYAAALPEFMYRHKIKAGLTGLAQVMGKYNTSPKDKLLFDLMYIEEYSILLDIKLMFMTIKILFMPDRAEGVEEGRTSALFHKNRPEDK